MHPDDAYDAWKEARSSEPAPDGFADRVVETCRLIRPPPTKHTSPQIYGALWDAWPVRAAVCSLAAAAFVARAASALGLWFVW